MKQANSTRFGVRLLQALSTLALVLIVLLIVTTPLGLDHQMLFGLAGVALLLVVGQFRSRWARLVLILMSVVISTRYLYWRATDTLVFDSVVEATLGVGLLLAECYAWLILVLGFFQTAWPLNRRIVPLPRDSRTWPTVDVYIPTYNESLEIVQDTVLAALNLDYPKDKLKVYLLDDGRRPEFGAFASAAGVGYITRSDNNHAKAGNLNNALKQTHGELVCVFDCDHVATRIFLQATVGAFVADPKLALLQTPHFFYSPDPFERNLAAGVDMPGEGELFYGPVQKGNDYWNAAFFCGSCAVIRRSALDETNGFAVETVTEDAHTALRLQRKGWNTAFLGLPLAAGLATERLALHVGQRARWARGMTQIFRVDNPLLGKGLSWPQRLCYLNAMLHFQFALPRVVFLTAPLAYLLFGLNIIAASPALILAYAVPHLFHAVYTNSLLQGRFRYSFWGEIYETVLAFALVRPTLATLLDPRKGKFNVTEKGGLLRDGYFDHQAVRPHLFALAMLLAGVVWGLVRLIWNDVFQIQPSVLILNLFWASFSAIILLAAISVARETRQVRNTVRIDIRLPAILHLANGHTLRTQTLNLSMGGMLLENPLGTTLDDSVVEDIEVRFDDKVLLFPVSAIALGEKGLRFRFKTLPVRQRRELVRVVMGRADAWIPDRPHAADSPVRSFFSVTRAVSGLFSGESKNSGWARWRRSLFGSWKFRLSLVAALALATSIIASRAWAAEPYQQQIRFKDAGVATEMVVTANGSSSGIHFSLRQDEMATDASLALSLRYPEAQFPEGSNLEVLLNGLHLTSILLDPFGGDGTDAQVPIPPALVLSHNDLSFRITNRDSASCKREQDDPNKVLIDGNSSLNLSLLRLPRPNDLAGFPAPFFDEGIMGQVDVPLVLPMDPSQGQLESGAMLASYFGHLAQFRHARFPVFQHSLPTANALALVTGNNLAGLNLVPPQGPELRLIDNPAAPLYKLLLVMGRDDEELKTAARYLVTQAGKLSGARVQAQTLTLPPRQPYDAPHWVGSQAPVTLGQLAKPEALAARGLYHQANEVNFRAAPDLFLWRGRGVPMQVEYLFPEGDWLDEHRSKLNVALNGQYLTSLPVNNGGVLATVQGWLGRDIRQQQAQIELPSYLLYGENKLSFYFDLRQHPDFDCSQLPAGVISRILPSSTIDLGAARHFTVLPNLSYFISAGFPFTRMADLSDTLALLPANPSVAELQTFFGLMGRMGDATGYPAMGIQVQLGLADGPALAGKDLLLVGGLDRLKASPLLAGSPFGVESSKLVLKPVAFTDRWHRFFGGDWGRQDKAARRQLESQDSFEGLASFISPRDPKRLVVMAATSQDAALPQLVQQLAQPSASSEVQGDLVLLRDDGIRSYRVGPQAGSGDLPWDMSLRWYFGQHVLQLLATLLLGIILGACLIYPPLRARARRRLPSAVGEDNE
ncbi:Cellulose synthase subunit AB [Gallaecimonas xiamenensis 3-C-1]|uniref:Cellulose synthase catalytic subunit [UDP-forming] n=1 Tax=Gallaecimonas xiamenensis 3-C-1 TaxID=745411 RepID=K2J202_9GAMM|nr:UDP-forming cellulose synthase catalytic subunit [Gallaecimonas xiamenensis]EKE77006.1 Cellulose synthase subunit AB [Gallaecimonas xiamenensis 3-C-1]